MIVRCVVAASNAGGEPDLFPVKVICSEEQYTNGEHYAAANQAAEDEGYEPALAFDENDPGGVAMMSIFTWSSAPLADANPSAEGMDEK